MRDNDNNKRDINIASIDDREEFYCYDHLCIISCEYPSEYQLEYIIRRCEIFSDVWYKIHDSLFQRIDYIFMSRLCNAIG